MRILFVHQNFPGQYRHLAASLAAEHEVVGLGDAANLRGKPPLAGVRRVGYDFAAADKGAAPWRPLRPLDAALRRAVVVARAAEGLKSEGFVPDVVCVHPGWGEGILLRDVWPDARTIGYFEFFYRPSGSDVGFDPEFSRGGVDASLIVRGRNVIVRGRNAALLLGMAACDAGVSPTHWQHRQLPDAFQRRCEVIHDGIDCTAVRPDPAAAIRLKRERLRLTRADEVVTYAVRNLEPYRGFHVFMRALPELLRRRPRAHVLIVGGNETSYSPRPAGARTWKATLMAEVGARLDIVYLTYPFVLSWSCLEAMAAACPIVASRTPPVEEVIDDGQQGLLVDFFDQEALLATIGRQLDRRDEARAMGERARLRVLERYDLTTVCLPRQRRLLLDACNGRGA